MEGTKVVKAIEMISVLHFKKGENEIKIDGNLSNEEKKHLIATLLRDGWQAGERII